MPDLPDEPDTNEPIPVPENDDTGIVSGNDGLPGAASDDPVHDQEPSVEPASPADWPSPKADPAAEQDPKVEPVPGEPPADLDDGPLVALNANRQSKG